MITRWLAAIWIVGFAACHSADAQAINAKPKNTQPKNAEPTSPERINSRDYPSVFQAWNPAQTVKPVPKAQLEARHDLLFHSAEHFGLRWDAEHRGRATRFKEDSLQAGRRRRAELLKLNPKMVLLCEIRYRDAPPSHLPTDSPWWKRDEAGEPIIAWKEGGYLMLDFTNPGYRQHVAERAAAAVACGVFDGVMLDWWVEDEHRIALAQAVRKAIGEDGLLLVNANDRVSPRSARHINGHFMECYRSVGREDWDRIESSLCWAEENLRQPRINCLEIWYAKSRSDLGRMRATTTLGLTRSDGYVLFGDPNPLPTPDHLHDWYPFWDTDLGRPVAPGKKRGDGSVVRRFENGTVVYNPPGAATTITFATPHRRVSDGRTAKTHKVDPLDGDIFLSVP